MKNRIIATFMALLVITATALTALAAGGVELPMVPIGGLTTIDMAIDFRSDITSAVKEGDSVTFKTNISAETNSTKKLSKAVLEYTYSEGLVFEDNVSVLGNPEGWSIGTVSNSENKVSFTVFAEDIKNSVDDITVEFSFKVSKVSGEQQTVRVSSYQLYDENGLEIERISDAYTSVTFVAEVAVPAMSNIGAALRINNTPAMRFGMTVETDNYFKIAFPSGFTYSDDANMKFGMLIIEKSKLSGSLTADTSGATVHIFKEVLESTANELTFAYTMENITDYTKEYTFRPFAMYRESADEEYQYYYAGEKSKSARYVAEMEFGSGNSSEYKDLLEKFIK